MAEFDTSPYAVSGPGQVAVLAGYYEGAGIPFHAWCIVKGEEPLTEARIAADVLAAGARSLYISIQGREGFWQGTEADAEAFGAELRRLQPEGRIVLCIDPRPWETRAIPLSRFAAHSDALAPQQSWRSFDTAMDREGFREAGFEVPESGVTPEFLAAVTRATLGGLGLPMSQVADVTSVGSEEFGRFLDAARSSESDFVSVWRFGEMAEAIFDGLRAAEPRLPPPATSPTPQSPSKTHVVQAGETLSLLAERYGVSVDAIVQANSLTNPDMIIEGQTLIIP
jgi:LysM repeat protein